MDSSQKWGVDRLIANKGKVTFTIPSCIPAGQYLMRHEIIALHAASSYPGAQFYVSIISYSSPISHAMDTCYCCCFFLVPGREVPPSLINSPFLSLSLSFVQMECAQLQITGGGSTQPATVSFPGAYKGSDPGITINIYQTLPSYTVPGMFFSYSHISLTSE